jgi:surfeit locus 1 family protein
MRLNPALLKLWLFIALFFPTTLALGFWQLDRAAEKKLLQNEYQDRMTHAPVGLAPETPLERFTQVLLTGRYLEPSLFLDNRTRDGKVGYEVLNVFELASGGYTVVNRGWIIAPKLRSELPASETPSGVVELQGYTVEGSMDESFPIEVFDTGIRIQSLDFDLLEERYDVSFIGRWLVRLNQSDAPGAEKIGWPSQNFNPQKHYGYAVQWFGLAVALMLLGLFATRKIIRQDK